MMAQPAFIYPNSPYLPSAAATATDAYAGTSAQNVLSATEDTYWRPANLSGTKHLTIDLIDTRLIDCLALLGQGLDGATVEVRASTDNFAASNVQIVAPTVLVSQVNAAWLPFDGETAHIYRYWRLSFTTLSSAFRVAWVSLADLALLPYFESDPEADSLDIEAEDLISPQGLYLGTAQQSAMRAMSLEFGQVTDAEFFVINHWAGQCLRTKRPFFVVPDTDDTAAYFGWVRDKRFSAPLKNGLREVSSLTFMTRAA